MLLGYGQLWLRGSKGSEHFSGNRTATDYHQPPGLHRVDQTQRLDHVRWEEDEEGLSRQDSFPSEQLCQALHLTL